MSNKGFTLIEMLVAIAILSVLLGVAVLNLPKFLRVYKYKEDVFQVEMVIKNAKLKAMERTTNVIVCVDNNKTLRVVDVGTDRGSRNCNGNTLYTVNLSSFSNFDTTTGTGFRFMFDPRGLAVVAGNVCLSNGEVFTKFRVQDNAGRILIERGSGTCN
ncbi:MAG TPA: type II secretion system protein [Sulfurihydrogenibium azorense]|uniref:Type II secretion system protein n=1 Tax=Sulfurihydrogenibium azorense TaxID=309806 RepID=A0A832DAR8_9AQUI|nr:type II secretion system protein [Sulfurihydrogenibium azorense]